MKGKSSLVGWQPVKYLLRRNHKRKSRVAQELLASKFSDLDIGTGI